MTKQQSILKVDHQKAARYNYGNKMQKPLLVTILLMFVLLLSSIPLFAQSEGDAEKTESLFGSETDVGFAISPLDLKITGIQGKIGTYVGLYGGVLLNRSLLIGLAGYMNVGHPDVNSGYLGLFTQYTYKPENLFHASGQILVGIGTTKDYQAEKSSLFDNFGNIFGARFFVIEPGINVELNLSSKTRLVTGLSYRLVLGLDENSEHVALTELTSKDMRGLSFNIGVKLEFY